MAQKIEVTTGKDGVKGSLRRAIELANSQSPNATVKIIITPSVNKIILNDGEIVISRNIIIKNLSEDLEIAALGRSRIFHVTSNVEFTKIISKAGLLSFKTGYSLDNGGAILVDNPCHELIANKCKFSDNSAEQFGGAIYSQGNVILISCILSSNVAGSQGGATWTARGITLHKSVISHNVVSMIDSSSGGGGIYNDTGSVIVNQSEVVKNKVLMNFDKTAGGSGGGIVNMNGSTYIQNNSHIDNNTAFNSGGIQQGRGDLYIINKSTVNGNRSFNQVRGSDSGGGGVTINLGTTYVSNSQICDNKTVGMYSAGVVSLLGDVIVVDGSEICRNHNRGPGGGIAANIGTVTIVGSKIEDNIGAALGGGIVNFAPSPAVITVSKGSSVSGNTLTNAETIGQTIAAFLQVVSNSLNNMQSQAVKSQGPGTQELLNALSEVGQRTQQLSLFFNLTPNTLGGGGIASLTTGPIMISDSKVENNRAGEKVSSENAPFFSLGGGVFGFEAPITIENSSITGNSTTTRLQGGGVWSGVSLNVSNSKVVDNFADGRSNDIFIKENGIASIIDSKINQNAITNEGQLTIIK